MKVKSYAIVRVILNTTVIFEHDRNDSAASSKNHAKLYALTKLGIHSDEGIEDVEVLEMDWAHDDARVTKNAPEMEEASLRSEIHNMALIIEKLSNQVAANDAIHEYLNASFELQDLLKRNDSGVRINAAKSDPMQLEKVKSISRRMWATRKKIDQPQQQGGGG